MSKLLTGLDDSLVPDRPNDMILAKEIADTLTQHYPGHLWAVHVNGEGGVADIRNMLLSGQMGYLLKLVNMYSASDFKRDVIRAGGEILERYRMARGRFNEAQYAGLATTFSGDFAYDQ